MKRDLRFRNCFKALMMMVFFGIGNLGFGQYSYTSISTTYSQNFVNLPSTGTATAASGNLNNYNANLNGWYFLEAPANTVLTAGTGSVNSGDTYSFGSAGSADRALGGVRSGSASTTIGFYFKNDSGTTITSLLINYVGEQWRLGALSRVDRLDFQYSLNATTLATGTWVDVDALDFTAPTTTGTTGALDGNLSVNRSIKTTTITGLSIADGSSIFIRWNDLDAAGADDGLSVDDFTIVGNPIIWDGTIWSNTVGPNAATDATINGAFTTTANGTITAKKLTVATGGSLTVNSGTNITLAEGLVNNLAAADVVVENNANIIQTTGTTNLNTGAITVKRNSNALMLLDYGMWGSPVSGQQLQAFSPATLSNRFYTYDSTNNVYAAETATNNFADGKGYLIRMPNDHPTTPTVWTGSFAGVPHSGDYTFTPAVGFNSVANPYPSTLSMATFVTDNPTITGTLYFWRKTNSTTVLPGYCSWNSGTYVSNGQPGAISDVAGNDMLQVGQGFIVKATATTGVLFKNTQRTGNNDNQNYKAAANATVSADEKNRVWLNLTSANGSFSQMAFGYMTNATNEVDSYDGESFNDGNVSLSSLISNQKFVIQGKALPFVNTDLVPLNFKVNASGNYTIAIDNVDGLFANNAQAVYLRDALLNTEVNLSATDYSFASAQGEFNNRFVVAFTPQTLGNPQFNNNTVVIYKNNDNVIVNSGNAAIESVKVFDLTGRLLFDKNNINETSTTFSIAAQNQVVLVQVKDINGNVVSKKMIN